jgi:pyrroloquinoline quinone (PQQ) biosynthesis protein C
MSAYCNDRFGKQVGRLRKTDGNSGCAKRSRQRIGEERYHHQHPFHLLMHEGRLTPGQLQAWALNRCYYQSRVPMKDAIVLSRSEDSGFRRAWRKRLVDQDGQANAGGLECWVQLAEATGLPRKLVTSCAEVLSAVRYASRLIAVRLDALRRHYPWLQGGLGYFEARLSQAPEDPRFAFEWAYEHARTREDQARAPIRKCDVLWAQLDALYFAYVERGWPPRGAFRPE